MELTFFLCYIINNNIIIIVINKYHINFLNFSISIYIYFCFLLLSCYVFSKSSILVNNKKKKKLQYNLINLHVIQKDQTWEDTILILMISHS